MSDDGYKVEFLDSYRRKMGMKKHAIDWEESLPNPSRKYPNLIFLYSEDLATENRDLLFRRLNSAAEQNKQKLVISDCHYSRAGLYISIDEIGGDVENPIDIDAIVEEWSEMER